MRALRTAAVGLSRWRALVPGGGAARSGFAGRVGGGGSESSGAGRIPVLDDRIRPSGHRIYGVRRPTRSGEWWRRHFRPSYGMGGQRGGRGGVPRVVASSTLDTQRRCDVPAVEGLRWAVRGDDPGGGWGAEHIRGARSEGLRMVTGAAEEAVAVSQPGARRKSIGGEEVRHPRAEVEAERGSAAAWCHG